MKTLILTCCAIMFITNSAFSQLSNGKYKYSNAEIALSFTISDEGYVISEIVLTNKTINKVFKAEGEWFEVNRNGADAGYDGPSGWYQFQTQECNYDFNTPNSKLILSRFDCKNGLKEKEVQLFKN
jgi:hypothetical protein